MDISPRKCCVKFEPPTLVLFYQLKESGKLHRRSIPLRDFDGDEDDEDKIFDSLLSTPHHAKYIKVREFECGKLRFFIISAIRGGVNSEHFA